MKLNRYIALLATFALLVTSAFSQSPANAPNPGKYGLTAWAVNGQRIASQFNYYLDATIQNGLGGTFTFPASACSQALAFGGNRNVNPFAANATVNIQDIVSANTETVTGAAATFSGSTCTIPLAPANTHNSFTLRSGTCGLREALNDLGGQGGEVIVDQKFYDDGCTAATITGLTFSSTTPPIATQLIHDISNGKDTWYNLQPSTLTALAVPTAAVAAATCTGSTTVCSPATTGGTWPNSAEHVGCIYVDALGGWSVASTDASYTPTGTTSTMLFTSPAASTGAVGWLPFAGLAYNSTSYVLPVAASNCTLSTSFTGYPVCAIGSNATMLAPVTTTSLIPQAGGIAAAYNPNPQSHTTFIYAPSQRPGYPLQLNYGPFTAVPALTAGQLGVVGTVQLPTGFLQNLGIGGTVRFTFDVSNTPSTGGTATGVDVEIGDTTDFSTGTPKIVCTLLEPTATGTAATKYHEQCDWTVNKLGAAGTLMPGGFLVESVAAQGTVGNSVAEGGTAAITADILHQDSVYFVFLQTSGAETTTPPQMLNLKIEVLNN